MEVQKEINNLQGKVLQGEMDPDEPVFVLRAQDRIAAVIVAKWIELARSYGTPSEKLLEAEELQAKMLAWPVKQIPGRPETRVDRRDE